MVLDEATANIDLETDNLIQRKLRESFSESTVIVIAHRLATVIDVDRILVMEHGRGIEYNHPYKLMVESVGDEEITNPGGYFSKMVLASGKQTA